MTTTVKSKIIIEFGDFQTPLSLAEQTAEVVLSLFSEPDTVIEPTCGLGNFLKSTAKIRPEIKDFIGWEINPEYVKLAKDNLSEFNNRAEFKIQQQDFFSIDWKKVDEYFSFPLLFIGNPPWVTNTELGNLDSSNLPNKSNFQGFSGFEAISGKSNFDISEWMLIKIAEYISNKDAAMAFLVKTSVARKLFLHICKNKLAIEGTAIYHIDAKKHFNVNVDACLFYTKGVKYKPARYNCKVHESLEANTCKLIGQRNGKLIADIKLYDKLADIDSGCELTWRSGIKHDCSKVMELKKNNSNFVNGFNEEIRISDEYLYPMYKSSDISKDSLDEPRKFMIVTQKRVGEETKSIKVTSPSTWEYLQTHSSLLDKRKSSIYKKSPRFSVFGVGEYSFEPWKVAISGLYKNTVFSLIGPYHSKPIVFDDTCYLLSFDSQEKASFVYELLTSSIATEFIQSIVFKDNKRPITVALLKRINIMKIAEHLGCIDKYNYYFSKTNTSQKTLFDKAI
ncbi:MAG: SAM-dependent methyltransferase [Phycisphaerae bacterium]|nr:SAM-dependent methyltransferase [Phycisphaerae bacterium]